MAPALDFVMLYVSNMDAALEYFTDQLGFERAPEQDTPIFRYLRGGAGGIDFALRQVTPGSAAAGSVEVYFATPDLPGLHAELAGRGAQVSPIERRPFAAIFGIGAPDGHLLTAMEKA